MKFTYLIYGRTAHYSQAAVNRMNLICLGLRSCGIEAGVREIYSDLNRRKLTNILGHLICIFKTIGYLFSEKRNNIIAIYGYYPYYFIFKFFSKRRKLLIEKLEYSSHLITNSNNYKATLLSKRFERSLKSFDLFLTCSQTLKEYYQKFTKYDCKYLIIPVIFDFNKFSGDNYSKKSYIGYCGDFGNNKDGVQTLIKAFKIISDKYSTMQLFLAGGTSDKVEMNKIKDLVSELVLIDRVIFLGFIDHNHMPQFLNEAYVLALARPNNLQAQGGFPSKIAEYLASGRPVVVTKVGELGDYLTDKKNVFFSKSDTESDFAECLDFVLENEFLSEKVGFAGKELSKSFDYSIQGKLIKDFVDN